MKVTSPHPGTDHMVAWLHTVLRYEPETYSTASHSVTVVLDFLRYVVDLDTRSVFTEVRTSRGSWESGSPWYFDSPLRTWDWIDAFLHCNAVLVRDDRGKRPTAIAWKALRAKLKQEAMASGLMPGLREAVRRAIPLDAEVLRIASAIAPHGRATSEDYTEAWRSGEEWSRLVSENAGLALLLRNTQREGSEPKASDGFEWLKGFYSDLGLGQAGWRIACRHASALLENALQTRKRPEDAPLLVALQAHLLRGFTGKLPRTEILMGILGSLHMLRDCYDVNIPHRMIELADAACNAAEAQGRLAEFLEDEWQPMLAWVIEAEPVFHRNQWAGGWPCLLKAKARWALRKAAVGSGAQWRALQTPIAFPNHVAVELDSSAKLAVEGVEMCHCIADFEEQCMRGRQRVFSLRARNTGRRVATIACFHDALGWQVDNVKGRANAEVSEEVWQVADGVAAACGAAA